LDGELVTERIVYNAVLRSGAQILADLFTGKGKPITHLGVGTSDAPETEAYNTTALTNDPGEPLQGATEAAIPAEDFLESEVDETRRVVKVRVRATLPPEAAVGVVREAGLISRDDANAVLYNRVTFAPIQKGDDHELTLFWEISFPYGDLQWLM
jgi:hypothetical protein